MPPSTGKKSMRTSYFCWRSPDARLYLVTFPFCRAKCVSRFLSAFLRVVAIRGSQASSRNIPLSRFAGLFWLVCWQLGRGWSSKPPSIVSTSVWKVCSFSVQLSIHHWLFSPFSLQWFSPRVDRIIPFGFEPVFCKENVTGIAVLRWDSCQSAASIIRIDSLKDVLLKLRKHFWGQKVLTGHFENRPLAFLTKNLSWLAHWKVRNPWSSRLLDTAPLLVMQSAGTELAAGHYPVPQRLGGHSAVVAPRCLGQQESASGPGTLQVTLHSQGADVQAGAGAGLQAPSPRAAAPLPGLHARYNQVILGCAYFAKKHPLPPRHFFAEQIVALPFLATRKLGVPSGKPVSLQWRRAPAQGRPVCAGQGPRAHPAPSIPQSPSLRACSLGSGARPSMGRGTWSLPPPPCRGRSAVSVSFRRRRLSPPSRRLPGRPQSRRRGGRRRRRRRKMAVGIGPEEAAAAVLRASPWAASASAGADRGWARRRLGLRHHRPPRRRTLLLLSFPPSLPPSVAFPACPGPPPSRPARHGRWRSAVSLPPPALSGAARPPLPGAGKMSDTKVKVAVRVRPMNRRGNRALGAPRGGGGTGARRPPRSARAGGGTSPLLPGEPAGAELPRRAGRRGVLALPTAPRRVALQSWTWIPSASWRWKGTRLCFTRRLPTPSREKGKTPSRRAPSESPAPAPPPRPRRRLARLCQGSGGVPRVSLGALRGCGGRDRARGERWPGLLPWTCVHGKEG